MKKVENPFITQKAITDFKIRIDSEIQNEEELSDFALDKDTKRNRTRINHLLNFVGQPSFKEEYTDFAAHNAERQDM